MTDAQRQARHRVKRRAEFEALQSEREQLRAEVQQLRTALEARPPAEAGKKELLEQQQECEALRAKVATGREAVGLLLLWFESPALRNQMRIRLKEKGLSDWL